MFEQQINNFIKETEISGERLYKIRGFLQTVPFSKISPYIELLRQNPEIFQKMKTVKPELIKDHWDVITELYRYNIRLSNAVYPYIFLLETVLKTKITKYLCDRYGENWYSDEELFLNCYGLNEFDKNIFNRFYQYENYQFREAEIYHIYIDANNEIGKNKLRNKINKFNFLKSIISESRKYLKDKKNSNNVYDFIERMPTLNYWITLIKLTDLWQNDSQKSDLNKIFININNLKNSSDINKKLDDIRDLRNYISHHNKILGEKAIKIGESKKSLKFIYDNIIELFQLMGCDYKWMMGNLQCNPTDICNGNNFEDLYNEFPFIHDYEIIIENSKTIAKDNNAKAASMA